ncbi:hypothetical protein EV562_1241, partial [Streptomyces sp. BK208]
MARRCGVPLRPPVPPQRHDCPQLRGGGAATTRGDAATATGTRVRRERGRRGMATGTRV